MKTARKLFRLFKSVNEYKKIVEILSKGNLSQTDTLNALSRLAFLLYWFFDNLTVLASVKFLNLDAKQMNKYGAFWWFVGLILGQAVSFISLAEIAAEEAKLRKQERSETTAKELQKLKAKKFTEYLNILKQAGDMVTSSQAIEIPSKLGFNFNDGHVGLGGFVSAVITMYQLY
jgi:peroxin-11B